MTGPYYELRIYETVLSRLPGLAALMADEAPAVLRRLGFDLVMTYEGIGGPCGPVYGYLLRWPDLDTRMRLWDRFYSDPEWLDIYARRFGDGGRVERQNLSILRPAPIWERFRSAARDPVGGIYELRRYDTTGLQRATALERIGENLGAACEASGHVLGVFDTLIGASTRQVVGLIAWQDMRALTGHSAFADPAVPPYDAFFTRPARRGAAHEDLSSLLASGDG